MMCARTAKCFEKEASAGNQIKTVSLKKFQKEPKSDVDITVTVPAGQPDVASSNGRCLAMSAFLHVKRIGPLCECLPDFCMKCNG